MVKSIFQSSLRYSRAEMGSASMAGSTVARKVAATSTSFCLSASSGRLSVMAAMSAEDRVTPSSTLVFSGAMAVGDTQSIGREVGIC